MADLQYRMRDTFEALRLATQDNRWSAVAKYASELEAMAGQHQREFGSVYEVRATTSACR
jgi:hypothetical protein